MRDEGWWMRGMRDEGWWMGEMRDEGWWMGENPAYFSQVGVDAGWGDAG